MRTAAKLLALGGALVLGGGDIAGADTLPKLTPGPCLTSALTDARFKCGVLTVAERRGVAGSRSVILPYAIRPAMASARQKRPVAFLTGGPGGTNVGWSYLSLRHLPRDRRVVFLERRGAGGSRPALRCGPELTRDSLPRVAMAACLADLRAKGIDPGAYGTRAAIADLEDMRKVLGVAQFDLFGASYGTDMALTMMRDFPSSVHAAVLDSAYPPDVDPFSEGAANQLAALATLTTACEQDPGCQISYPRLRERLISVVEQLDRSPVKVADVTVHGAELLGLIFGVLADSSLSPKIPLIVDLAAAGDGPAILKLVTPPVEAAKIAAAVPPEIAAPAQGLWLSVECAERAQFAAPQKPHDAGWPQAFAARVQGEWSQDIIRACKDWPAEAASAAAHRPVKSTIPALIFAGEFDPITPVSWARHALETLSAGQLIVLPGEGHANAQGPCPTELIVAFLDHPAKKLETSCVAATRRKFISPPTSADRESDPRAVQP